jgi:hypothetical protein
MKLARVIPKVAGHPEIRSFECRPCGEAVSELDGEE